MNKKLMAVIGLEFAYEKTMRSVDRDAHELFDEAYKLANDGKSDTRLAAILKQIRSQMKGLASLKEPEDDDDDDEAR